jgi:quercetin dioxygenase-like cupin family protein
MANSEQNYDADYFVATDGGQEPTEPGRWVHIDDLETFSFAEGSHMRPVLGQNMLINYIEVDPHSPNIPHSHAEEQIVFIIEGEMEFTLGEETRMIGAGQMVIIPPWVRHGGGTHEKGARSIDIFNPPRAQLRALLEKQTDKK